MRRLDRIFGSRSSEARGLSWNDYMQQVFAYQGNQYTLPGVPTVDVGQSFTQYVAQIARSHGIVPAAVAARAFPISQIRFVSRNADRSSPQYGSVNDPGHPELARPSTMTRPGLLALAEAHHSYGGTAYFVRRGGFRLLRPDLVDVIIAGPDDAARVQAGEGDIVGFAHYHQGRDQPPETYGVDEVARWYTEPDPICWWRGMSWVGGVVRDVAIDRQLTGFVEQFLENSATPNIIIKPDSRLSVDQVKEFRKEYDRRQSGVGNAGRTLWLGGGSDIEVVGSRIGELAIRELQGGGETRVAVRSRVPAPLLSIREGMQGSALNASSYGQTRRLFADTQFVPSAEMLCSALQHDLFPLPAMSELAYDPDRVLLLQEDQKDAAEILATQATAINQLVAAGFTPTSAEKAIRTGNTAVLEHSGLVSVQLLPPGTTGEPDGGDG